MIQILEKNNKLSCLVDIPFSIGNVKLPSVKAIIDTGCQRTMISIGDMCQHYTDPLLLKSDDISLYRRGLLRASKVVGVNDRKKSEDISLLDDYKILIRDDICFTHTVSDLRINGFSLGSHEVNYNNYGYNSPTLIGMDILQKYDWEYSNGIFTLYEKNPRGLNVFDSCIQRVREMLGAKLMLSEVKNTLQYDYSDDMINHALFVALKDTYYEGE